MKKYYYEALIFLCVFLQGPEILGNSDCLIHIPKITNKLKIYLNGFHWMTPMDNFNGSKRAIEHSETVEMSCDNGFISDNFLEKTYTFKCTNGKFNNTFTYEDLFCKSDFHKNTKVFQIPNTLFRSKILKCQGKNLEVYQVGAKKADGSLKHLYTVCFDKNVMRTKFVFQPKRSEILIHHRQERRDIWGFDYFGKSAEDKLKLSSGYVSRIQKKRITDAFKNKYNRKNQYPFTFNRGHLAPYGDFIDYDDKKASCEYINVAPQWREFNGNSWSVIEKETRELVRNNPTEWEIYTGTYGSIPTTRGPLFVSPFFDQNGRFIKGFVPVPKLYWKLVYNVENKNHSRVFIGVNNPELKSPEEFTDKYLICKPRVNEQGKNFRGNEFKGFTYECNIGDFLEVLGKNEMVVKAQN